jgi:metal-dependent hydrolase (beta-lactamase superfamily II)
MEAEALKLIDEFRRLGVKRVAPCHCSGQEEGRKLFKDAYGDDCFDVGVGFTVKV